VVIWITDPDPDRDTGKTCLGGDIHCPNASSFILPIWLRFRFYCRMYGDL